MHASAQVMSTEDERTLKMRAIVRERYGTPNVLELRDIPRPIPKDNEVLIRIAASSVNPADSFMLTGTPYPIRLMTGLRRPKNVILGLDVAGVVEAVGGKVTHFRPGDAVYGELTTGGAYAEYVAAPEHLFALKPKNLTFEQAAAVPLAAMPGLIGLRDVAKVQPGQKVLINGASGGVGTFAVQIAKGFGADVTGVCSTTNADMVRSIGADHVIDYTQTDFTATSAQQYDVILDLVGSASLSACKRILTPTGVYISSVGKLSWVLKAFAASLLPGKKRVAVLATTAHAADLEVLQVVIEAGIVTPVIDRTYSLSAVPEALQRQRDGHARGKSIITIWAGPAGTHAAQ